MILDVPEAERRFDPVAQQERDDDRVPAKFRPIGPRVQIACDAEWSVMVSRAQDGLIIEHAHIDGGFRTRERTASGSWQPVEICGCDRGHAC
jgi:hypothetical protein